MSELALKAPAVRSRRPFIILAVILGAIAIGGLVYYLLNRGYQTTDDAEIDGSIYTIAPQIAGRIAAVAVDDNQHVTAGQVLATIDARDEQAALDKAEAQASVAAANAAEADANVAVADAAYMQAQQDFARYEQVNPHAVSKLTLDASTAAIRSAKAKYDAANAQAQAMQAQADAAKVDVTNAKLQLSYTSITAPASGHVAQKSVEPGNVVAAGAGLMALVGDDVWVTANFKETQLAGIHPGSPATVTVDAIPGVTFKAHVDSIQFGTGSVFSLLPAQNATGNYVKIVQRVPVKIVFDDARIGQYLVAPGMSVLPSISLGK
jgi:membrane fusion protein (multidrug efflux system)